MRLQIVRDDAGQRPLLEGQDGRTDLYPVIGAWRSVRLDRSPPRRIDLLVGYRKCAHRSSRKPLARATDATAKNLGSALGHGPLFSVCVGAECGMPTIHMLARPGTGPYARISVCKPQKIPASFAAGGRFGAIHAGTRFMPSRRLAPPSSQRRDADGNRAIFLGTFRPRHHHAQSGAAGGRYPNGCRLSPAHSARRARRRRLHAADDALPDRGYRCAGCGRRFRKRAGDGGQALSGRRHPRPIPTTGSPTSRRSIRFSKAWPKPACRFWCMARSPIRTSTFSTARRCSSSGCSIRCERKFRA